MYYRIHVIDKVSLSTLVSDVTSEKSRRALYDTFRLVVQEKVEEAKAIELLSNVVLAEQKEALGSQCVDVVWLLYHTTDRQTDHVASLLSQLVEKNIVSRPLVVERLPKELAAPLAFSAPIKPESYLQKVIRINTVTLYVYFPPVPSPVHHSC